MAIAASVQKLSSGHPVIEKTAKFLHVWLTLVFSGSYTTGGDTLDLSSIFSSLQGYNVPSGLLPFQIWIYSQKAGQTNMFIYNGLVGATISTNKVQIFTGAAAQTALTELSAGAYAAGITGDTVYAEVLFPIL